MPDANGGRLSPLLRIGSRFDGALPNTYIFYLIL